MKTLALALVLFLLATALPAGADDKKEDPSKNNLPVEVKLTLKKTEFKLDLGADELKKALEAAKEGGKAPMPPALEGVIEIKNKSDKEIQIWQSGDPVVTTFELKGPGVVNFKPLLAFTADFKLPVPGKLAPGKSMTIPVKSLVGGFRGASEYTYWSEAGEYTLVAKFKTGISPAPEGIKPNEEGFAELTLSSNAVKVKVAEKK